MSLLPQCSVADPHHVAADPDPPFHVEAGLDPHFLFDADPDPIFHFWDRILLLLLVKVVRNCDHPPRHHGFKAVELFECSQFICFTGSGDGRIVLAAAQAGFKAVGVELNPWLVFYSRREQFYLLFC